MSNSRKSNSVKDVTIDDYGRIFVPKPIRDRLGLTSGSKLELSVTSDEEDIGSITLRPKTSESPLGREGELLVHTGRLIGEDFDVAEHLREQREERAARHIRPKS